MASKESSSSGPTVAVPQDQHTADVLDTREGPMRYVAYLARTKKLLLAKAAGATRYVAYSSDVGEAMRPVVSPTAVKAAYGLAFAYVGVDVASHGYKEWQKGDEGEVGRAVAHATVFQLLASIAAPTAIIHTAVHGAQSFTKKIGRFTKWGPSVVGLALIPVLPYTVDEPIEYVIDKAFDEFWPPAAKAAAQTDKKKEL